MGKGWIEREIELVTPGVAFDQPLVGEFGQTGAKGGGTDAAEFSQLLDRGRFGQLSQSLADPLHGRERVMSRGGGRFHQRKGPSRISLTQLQGDVFQGSGGAMFSSEGQLGTAAAHEEV